MSLTKIEKSFLKMKKRGSLDSSVIKELNKYKEKLVNEEKKFFARKNVTDYFDFYYALKTQIRIIASLIDRIQQSTVINDNPKVVNDALSIFPNLELLDLKLKKEKYNDKSIFDVASSLQILALRYNLYPSSTDIFELTNKKDLKKNFNLFVEMVDEELYAH